MLMLLEDTVDVFLHNIHLPAPVLIFEFTVPAANSESASGVRPDMTVGIDLTTDSVYKQPSNAQCEG